LQFGKQNRRVWLFRVITLAIAILISLLTAEAILRAVEKSSLGDATVGDNLVPDAELGHKLQPYSLGHDANGFRNRAVPSQADIVAIGDSLTWGINAKPDENWPSQLARSSGREVYSMALGGYGPVQYAKLVERAISLSPRVIVVAVYFGNDIYDAYSLSYSLEQYRDLRSDDALKTDTALPHIDMLVKEQREFHNRFGRTSSSGLSYWLREHSAIGRYLNRARLWPGYADVDYEIDSAWARAHPAHGAVFDRPPRTVFMTAYRLAGVDLDEPRIVEGLRITKAMLWRMRASTEGRTHLLVVFLPSKEAAYDVAGNDQTFQRLVEMEGRVREELASYCREQKIECASAQPALSNAIRDGSQVYLTSTDGHPSPEGYSVIASFVREELARLGW
jgi:hypothetical protein